MPWHMDRLCDRDWQKITDYFKERAREARR